MLGEEIDGIKNLETGSNIYGNLEQQASQNTSFFIYTDNKHEITISDFLEDFYYFISTFLFST